MAILTFIFCIFTSVLMAFCISWSNTYLFDIIGYYDDKKPILSYHYLTVPARIVAICLTFGSVCLCAGTWACFLVPFLI